MKLINLIRFVWYILFYKEESKEMTYKEAERIFGVIPYRILERLEYQERSKYERR